MEISLPLLSFVIFVLVVLGLLVNDRKKLKREGIVFMRRTSRGINIIDSIANRLPRFWKVMSVIGVIVAIGGMIFGSYFIITSAMNTAAGGGGGVKVVLPAPVSNAVSAPAVLFVPWYFWVIGILTLTIPHEFFHGIMSRLYKLKVKSVGWFFLVIIPGAFVEPDDKQLKEAKASTKLKVYGAGSFANFIMAFIFFGVGLFYVGMTLNTVGVIPSYLESGLPMANFNATGAILHINNVSITSQEILQSVMASIPPSTIVTVETTESNYTFATVASATTNGSRIGVIGPYYEYREVKPTLAEQKDVIFFFGQLFDWILILNLGVGLVNLLPLKPLDGGLMMETIVEKFSGRNNRRTKIIVNLITAAFVVLLIYSIFGGLFH